MALVRITLLKFCRSMDGRVTCGKTDVCKVPSLAIITGESS